MALILGKADRVELSIGSLEAHSHGVENGP